MPLNRALISNGLSACTTFIPTWIRLFVTGLSFLLVACAVPPNPAERLAKAQDQATKAHWYTEILESQPFALRSWSPVPRMGRSILTVYLEGDGLAWLDSETPSQDPTPLRPLALDLALHDPGSAVYLARPCQYLNGIDKGCAVRFWTSHRFAPEVIEATNQALQLIKQRWAAQQLLLVGYSGGGAVALLVAARRTDVAGVVTVAGNLDPAAWARLKHLSPLSGSLNPADAVDQLTAIQQWHWVGGSDRVMPPFVAEHYRRKFPPGLSPRIIEVPGYDHQCCWVNDWAARIQAVQNELRVKP